MAGDRPGWSGVVHGSWGDLARIRALLDAGADPDGPVWDDERPLHVAAEEGSPEVVAELAGRVTDVDAVNRGRTALWNAVYHRRPDNVRALLAAGADPWRPMMAGWSPGRLALASPGLFTLPGNEAALSGEEAAMAAAAPRLTEIFADHLDGLGLACVAGIGAAEAVRRLDATPFAVTEAGPCHEPPRPDDDLKIVGATDVPGGCVITQPWGYAPQLSEVMAPLSAGTFAYGLYVNPKSGSQGCVFRDGACEKWDLHPGGDPFPDATAREVLAGHLTSGNAVAYTLAYAGLRPPDGRAVQGPPDLWLRLPR
ncbi:ankyrin repeat domain-containing protein [Actinomadura sp. DC4]|uniref:ankyrin repeat domain-containing protein n=1 Tax=Actinomadura sp. DC4 TaxID=3055069 RepID=UPI0025B17D5A|nr:ankyrin repeat domain-containing protein [Actinomadura sp. DC4]MDN3352209.1 ankyrin repeat domain-containing protein [Actinomadura sp. DC4]